MLNKSLAMVRYHAEGENEKFLTIALHVAIAATRKGHRTVAEDIRAAVKKAQSEKTNGLSAPIPFTHPLGNLTGLLEQRPDSMSIRTRTDLQFHNLCVNVTLKIGSKLCPKMKKRSCTRKNRRIESGQVQESPNMRRLN